MDLAIRQSQAEIAELRWHRKVALFEWLKNTFQRVRADPAPAIAELDLELGGYHYRSPRLDDPAWRCELDGVTQKVPKYLLKSTGVPLQMQSHRPNCERSGPTRYVGCSVGRAR
jgi:hypothetical protein